MKFLPVILLASVVLFGYRYEGSTTSAVTLVGGIIKSTHIEPLDTKYKRKNCPVCKGTGKYLSGDGIKMVDCGYCEIEKSKKESNPSQIETKVMPSPPIILHQNGPTCSGPECQLNSNPRLYRRNR